MNTESFINAIKTVVYKGAAKGIIDILERPPGRRPDAELVQLSRWFQGLSLDDRAAVERIIDMTANQATYNFCLVLDGMLAIESGDEKGKLELVHHVDEKRTLINDEDAEQLSFLFKEHD